MDPVLLRAAVETTEALLVVVDGEGRILLANPALERFTGRSAAELLGRHFTDVYVVPEHVALARDAVSRAVATGQAHPQEGDWLTGTGERRRIAMRNTVLTDEAGRPHAIACVAVDVTEDPQRHARLLHRAETDLLTGIANRAVLFEVLRVHQEGGAGCGVLFCDLDDFKEVNDAHGHPVGDGVLAEVAGRLAAAVPPEHLVARFGGDEFVVVCPAASAAELEQLAAEVAERMTVPFTTPAGPLRLGVSVGVAVGRDGETADELIARADRAMYGVKTHRRRRSVREDPPETLR
ncbi:sensor domain-containing diguanylate cyclase [Blastococcus sp. TF02A-26]|nr:sensor domain-containing diguanylate cyclase [Blastococcus sp. TF02A-26]